MSDTPQPRSSSFSESLAKLAARWSNETEQASDFLRSPRGTLGLWVTVGLVVLAFIILVVTGN